MSFIHAATTFREIVVVNGALFPERRGNKSRAQFLMEISSLRLLIFLTAILNIREYEFPAGRTRRNTSKDLRCTD